MNEHRLKENHSSESEQTTRVKVKNKQARKTVGITLLLSLLVEAKNRNLNISRIIEQALLSILEYYPRQNKSEIPNSACGSSDFLSSGSFLKENDWCRGPGLNRRQPGLQLRPQMKTIRVGRSPRLSYLGNVNTSKERQMCF